MLIFLISLAAVALFMLGLSITLIRTGRDLQGDVGSNDEMKKRGLECTSAQIRREEAALRGSDADIYLPCGTDSCDSCPAPVECNK